jgi:hypothetical protein
MGAALIEILDRDGQVRQAIPVAQWPLRIGRALDNDVVLSDPHVAAHHLVVADHGAGLELAVAETRNGVLLGRRRLRSGEQAALAAGDDPIELTAGRTRLRLRLPGHALAPEVALLPAQPLARRLVPIIAATLVLIGGALFNSYLNADPDTFARNAGSTLLAALVGGAVWCGAWALLSKTFAHQARFGWHVRVFLFASIGLMVVNALPALLGFALSWPWLTDFAFVGEIAVAAAALYFHLLAVEPARYRLLKWVAATCAVVGFALTLWFNVQRTDQYGDELYMNHLFPPGLRLARPIATDTFINELAALKPALDKKAKEPGRGDATAGGEDD